MFRYLATVLAVLMAVSAHAELSGVVGLQDSRTSLNLTVQTKDKPLTAALELPTRQVFYGFRAEADWLRGHYYWTSPNDRSYNIPASQWFSDSKSGSMSALIGGPNRSYEWQLAADLTTYVNDGWRTPVRPYVGYGRSSTGWTFKGQEAKDGSIDLAWTQQVTFVGVSFAPVLQTRQQNIPNIILLCDYGWTRTVLGGNRQSDKELTRIDGTLKGHRWHAGVATEWPVADGWLLGLIGDWYQTTSAGDVNYQKDKDSFPGSGSMDGREWKICGEVKARW